MSEVIDILILTMNSLCLGVSLYVAFKVKSAAKQKDLDEVHQLVKWVHNDNSNVWRQNEELKRELSALKTHFGCVGK